jgi:CRP/FNR family cyclic AMP-dependent transcriptional regulator
MTGPPADQFECASCPSLSGCVLSALNVDSKTVPQVHWTRFSPGETIFRQGFPALGWYILCRGRAKLFLRTAHGKRLILRFGKPGDLLNPTVFGPHSFSAGAIDHCRIGFFDRDRVLFLLREHPELLKEALGRLSLWEERLAQRLEDLVALSIRERLVRALLELRREHGIHEAEGIRIDLPLSQRDLADLVGASRQTVCHELQRLAKEGLVRVEARRIIVTDQKGPHRSG